MSVDDHPEVPPTRTIGLGFLGFFLGNAGDCFELCGHFYFVIFVLDHRKGGKLKSFHYTRLKYVYFENIQSGKKYASAKNSELKLS